jgi:heptosyltransferase-1
MRVLIVKTSSLGDILHTFPALTDAGKALPGIQFDWIVEENFAQIPRWHPLVQKIIPVAWRRWRKKIFSFATWRELAAFRKNCRADKYDLIIDAQGLVKSAIVTLQARGTRAGLDWNSAREKYASLFYQRKSTVIFQQHAVVRARQLFSQLLGYAMPTIPPQFGIERSQFLTSEFTAQEYLVFFHGTTWVTKHWPEEYWIELVRLANATGMLVKLPWGNAIELERAQRIAAASTRAEVLPLLDLAGVAAVVAGARAIVAVDTGLGHLAAALDVPAVSLYGPTNPAYTGATGKGQIHLAAEFICAPCYQKTCTYPGNTGGLPGVSSCNSLSPLKPQCFFTLLPSKVWGALTSLLESLSLLA